MSRNAWSERAPCTREFLVILSLTIFISRTNIYFFMLLYGNVKHFRTNIKIQVTMLLFNIILSVILKTKFGNLYYYYYFKLLLVLLISMEFSIGYNEEGSVSWRVCPTNFLPFFDVSSPKCL